jgi:hypothetical protein
MLKGQIVYYNKIKESGLIETEKGELVYLKYNQNEQSELKKSGKIQVKHKFNFGDEVEFDIEIVEEKLNAAINVKFIKNEKINKIIEEYNVKGKLVGYIKIIENDKFYVKHIPSKVWLKLDVSPFENNINENYYNRNNKEVSFELKRIRKNGNITASIIDKTYSKEYYVLLDLMNNADVVEGVITGKNNYGLFMKISESNLNCFLPLTKIPNERVKNIFLHSEKGETVLVIVERFDKSQIHLKLNEV